MSITLTVPWITCGFGFAGIKGADFKEFVATGADNDAAVAKWVEEHATKRPRVEIVKWNNKFRYMRISETPDKMQEFFEDYIPARMFRANAIHHAPLLLRYLRLGRKAHPRRLGKYSGPERAQYRSGQCRTAVFFEHFWPQQRLLS